MFNANKDNWADFKEIFKGILKISNLASVLLFALLRDRILEAAKDLLTGVREPAEAWELLNKRYKDEHTAILSALHELQSVLLPHGPAPPRSFFSLLLFCRLFCTGGNAAMRISQVQQLFPSPAITVSQA